MVEEDPQVKIDFYHAEIARCEKMLSNPNFVQKAPAALVQQEQQKLAKFKELLYNLNGEH